MSSAEHKLRERIKELNCLYELSRAAWSADNNLSMIVEKTLVILPAAMQHPELAEASITIDGLPVTSKGFPRCKNFIKATIKVDGKVHGRVEVGYRVPGKTSEAKPRFLAEETNLLKAVARELSLFIKRAATQLDKEKLEIQLQHAKRLAFVGELSAGIAHELNEPLSRILGFAQLIKKAGGLGEQQNEDIERIVKASLYTREIIKKLMIFSSQMPRQIVDLDLNSIIDNILYFIDVRFQSRGIRIVKQLESTLSLIQADEVQISQVLVNLITNAVHAMPDGGDITIVSRNKNEFVSLVVKDSGTGMTKEIREKIFEPFFTTKPVGQGTGLGLSVVQGIIQAHHGRIVVTSAPGKGSRFEILLPKTQNG